MEKYADPDPRTTLEILPSEMPSADGNTGIYELNGELDERTSEFFLRRVFELSSGECKGKTLLFRCSKLRLIRMAGTEALQNLLNKGISIQMDQLNQDCYAALLSAGMENIALRHADIPTVDVSECPLLGEGSNGSVYRIDEDKVVKVMKNDTSFDELLKERELTRKAFRLGVSCPISYGFALVRGKISLVNEMASSVSLLKLIKADPANIDRYMNDYVGLIHRIHSICGENLNVFPKRRVMQELFEKAEITDSLLQPEYRGELRKILESISEPEVLTHGDIQPRNVRISEAGAMFIDMETLSSGPSVIDLGALHRTLFADWEFGGKDRNTFLDLSAEDSRHIWNKFTAAYFAGQEESCVKRNLFYAEIIGLILAAAKLKKRQISGKETETAAHMLENRIDVWKTLR